MLQQDPDVPPLQPHGYVATTNKKVKGGDAMSNHNRLHQQAHNEMQFFKEKGLQDLVDQHRAASSNVLIGRLSEMYTGYVKREWAPDTLFQMLQVHSVRMLSACHPCAAFPSFCPPCFHPSPSAVQSLQYIHAMLLGAGRARPRRTAPATWAATSSHHRACKCRW